MTDPRDRTAEFLSAVRREKPELRLPKRNNHHLVTISGEDDPPGYPGAPHPSRSGLLPTSENSAPDRPSGALAPFIREVKTVNLGLTDTSEKLESLTRLVRESSSIHNFKQGEISFLTMSVNDEIQALKSRINSLEAFSRQNAAKAGKGANEHHKNIVSQLQGKYNKAVKSFKGVIQQTQQTLSRQQKRDKQYSKSKSRIKRSRIRTQAVLDLAADEKAPLIQGGGTGSQAGRLTQALAQRTDTYHEERAEAVQDIERAINELATMYERVAELVVEQGHKAERIAENVDNSLDNIDMGIGELQKYLSSVSTNRWLIIKVFAILIFFAFFFTLFVA